jgi:hypothetical protein
LCAVTAEARFLPKLAETWDGESDANQYVWYSEWRNLMAGFDLLERAYRAREMTSPQRARHHELRQLLMEAQQAPRDDLITTEALARDLGISAAELAAAEARIERQAREEAAAGAARNGATADDSGHGGARD